MLGNGSDELLQMLTTAMARPGAVVLAPDPSFVHVPPHAHVRQRCASSACRCARISRSTSARCSAAIEREKPALVWLAYPNNPDRQPVRRARYRADRSRGAGPGRSSTRRTTRSPTRRSCRACWNFPNLVVVRTLSKIGMAGVRLGYAAAHPAWIAEIDKVRPPYNVNALTQAVVPVLLRTRGTAGRAGGGNPARARARCGRAGALRRVTVFPTQANFLLVRVPTPRTGSRRCAMLASW